MTRTDLQRLSALRAREAKALLDAGLYDGAYYLIGYAVECALKACIAKLTKRHDFPNKTRVQNSYTHNLNQLVQVADLEKERRGLEIADPVFREYWRAVQSWSEESRYDFHTDSEAWDLFVAATARRHGVLRWIKLHW